MKTKAFFVFMLLLLLAIFTPKNTYAEAHSANLSTTVLQAPLTGDSDNRVKTLQAFLRKYDSPLADSAKTFVSAADKYQVDWKLLPAISGVESTFGNAQPRNCINAWGYNIYGSTTRCFNTYEDAITTITKDIRQTYMDKWGAKDVYEIGYHYAASPTWGYRVDSFMQELSDYKFEADSKSLPISL